MRLPVELIQEIIRVLSTPKHPSQFGHSPEILKALCELVLCNRLLHSIGTSFLYSSIIIPNRHALAAFLRTPPTARAHSRAIWVRSLPQHLFPVIADLLLTLSPYLRRIALDVPSNHIDHSESIRRALQRCSNLEEFMRWGYSPMQLFPPPFTFCPDWKHLRRLVLDGPLVDDNFICAISQMPLLTQFALIEPRWRYSGDGTEVATFRNFLNAARHLRRLLLIYCQPADVYLSSLRRLERGVRMVPRENLDVAYTVMRQKAPIPMNLIRDRIAEGTIWELESKALLNPYCSFLDETNLTSNGGVTIASFNSHAMPGNQQIPVRSSHNSY